MSAPSFLATWHVERGRHRAAIRLAACLLALGLSPTIARALADAFAPLSLIGGLFDGFDRLLRMPVPPALAAFAFVLAFAIRIHPALAPTYLAALTTTPWQPGRRLPLGDVGLTSSFVLLPAAAIVVSAGLGQPTTLPIAHGAILAYGGITLLAGMTTRQMLMPLAIAMLMVGLIPAWMTIRSPLAVPLLLVTIAVVSGLAQRSILAAAFGPEGVVDVRRLFIQKRSTLGWFENLPLSRKRQPWRLQLLLALAAGAVVTMIGNAAEAWDAKPWRGLLTTTLFVAGCIRFGLTFATAPLSYGAIARVLSGRWFVPRMDRLLLFPASMLGLIALFNTSVIAPFSEWNPVIGGACVSVAAMLCWWVAPSTLAWQTTGTSRILTVASKPQKQAEASLKRLTDPQSARSGSN